jgi:hypothetical protein
VEMVVGNDFQIHEAFSSCRLNSNHVEGRLTQIRIAAIGTTIVKMSARNKSEAGREIQ